MTFYGKTKGSVGIGGRRFPSRFDGIGLFGASALSPRKERRVQRSRQSPSAIPGSMDYIRSKKKSKKGRVRFGSLRLPKLPKKVPAQAPLNRKDWERPN